MAGADGEGRKALPILPSDGQVAVTDTLGSTDFCDHGLITC